MLRFTKDSHDARSLSVASAQTVTYVGAQKTLGSGRLNRRMDESAQPRAALFDIDGTLVDSNYLHVDAWSRAFAAVGHPVEAWRIHRAIGMDSAKLLETLLGDDADRFGDDAKQQHGELYSAMAERLRPLPGARALLRTLKERGVTVVLATSAPENELETLRRVLDSDGSVDDFTSSADVATAKPEPDIVRVALERAGAEAHEAVFVGDAVYDIEAAGRAGVPAIGVRSGGVAIQELLDAGAVAVYDDVADLLDHLEAALSNALDHAAGGRARAGGAGV